MKFEINKSQNLLLNQDKIQPLLPRHQYPLQRVYTSEINYQIEKQKKQVNFALNEEEIQLMGKLNQELKIGSQQIGHKLQKIIGAIGISKSKDQTILIFQENQKKKMMLMCSQPIILDQYLLNYQEQIYPVQMIKFIGQRRSDTQHIIVLARNDSYMFLRNVKGVIDKSLGNQVKLFCSQCFSGDMFQNITQIQYNNQFLFVLQRNQMIYCKNLKFQNEFFTINVKLQNPILQIRLPLIQQLLIVRDQNQIHCFEFKEGFSKSLKYDSKNNVLFKGNFIYIKKPKAIDIYRINKQQKQPLTILRERSIVIDSIIFFCVLGNDLPIVIIQYLNKNNEYLLKAVYQGIQIPLLIQFPLYEKKLAINQIFVDLQRFYVGIEGNYSLCKLNINNSRRKQIQLLYRFSKVNQINKQFKIYKPNVGQSDLTQTVNMLLADSILQIQNLSICQARVSSSLDMISYNPLKQQNRYRVIDGHNFHVIQQKNHLVIVNVIKNHSLKFQIVTAQNLKEQKPEQFIIGNKQFLSKFFKKEVVRLELQPQTPNCQLKVYQLKKNNKIHIDTIIISAIFSNFHNILFVSMLQNIYQIKNDSMNILTDMNLSNITLSEQNDLLLGVDPKTNRLMGFDLINGLKITYQMPNITNFKLTSKGKIILFENDKVYLYDFSTKSKIFVFNQQVIDAHFSQDKSQMYILLEKKLVIQKIALDQNGLSSFFSFQELLNLKIIADNSYYRHIKSLNSFKQDFNMIKYYVNTAILYGRSNILKDFKQSMKSDIQFLIDNVIFKQDPLFYSMKYSRLEVSNLIIDILQQKKIYPSFKFAAQSQKAQNFLINFFEQISQQQYNNIDIPSEAEVVGSVIPVNSVTPHGYTIYPGQLSEEIKPQSQFSQKVRIIKLKRPIQTTYGSEQIIDLLDAVQLFWDQKLKDSYVILLVEFLKNRNNKFFVLQNLVRLLLLLTNLFALIFDSQVLLIVALAFLLLMVFYQLLTFILSRSKDIYMYDVVNFYDFGVIAFCAANHIIKLSGNEEVVIQHIAMIFLCIRILFCLRIFSMIRGFIQIMKQIIYGIIPFSIFLGILILMFSVIGYLVPSSKNSTFQFQILSVIKGVFLGNIDPSVDYLQQMENKEKIVMKWIVVISRQIILSIFFLNGILVGIVSNSHDDNSKNFKLLQIKEQMSSLYQIQNIYHVFAKILNFQKKYTHAFITSIKIETKQQEIQLLIQQCQRLLTLNEQLLKSKALEINKEQLATRSSEQLNFQMSQLILTEQFDKTWGTNTNIDSLQIKVETNTTIYGILFCSQTQYLQEQISISQTFQVKIFSKSQSLVVQKYQISKEGYFKAYHFKKPIILQVNNSYFVSTTYPNYYRTYFGKNLNDPSGNIKLSKSSYDTNGSSPESSPIVGFVTPKIQKIMFFQQFQQEWILYKGRTDALLLIMGDRKFNLKRLLFPIVDAKQQFEVEVKIICVSTNTILLKQVMCFVNNSQETQSALVFQKELILEQSKSYELTTSYNMDASTKYGSEAIRNRFFAVKQSKNDTNGSSENTSCIIGVEGIAI